MLLKLKSTKTGFRNFETNEQKPESIFVLSGLSLDNPGDSRNIGRDVKELRIKYGPGYRVYFVHRGKDAVVLLHGGTKQRQQRDIEKAKNLAQNIVVEHHHEE